MTKIPPTPSFTLKNERRSLSFELLMSSYHLPRKITQKCFVMYSEHLGLEALSPTGYLFKEKLIYFWFDGVSLKLE